MITYMIADKENNDVYINGHKMITGKLYALYKETFRNYKSLIDLYKHESIKEDSCVVEVLAETCPAKEIRFIEVINSSEIDFGEWNQYSFSSGVFNTQRGNIRMFNKPSIWTYEDWKTSEAKPIMDTIAKSDNRQFCWWWELTEQQKGIICSLPNFDADIFREITGIDINAKPKGKERRKYESIYSNKRNG